MKIEYQNMIKNKPTSVFLGSDEDYIGYIKYRVFHGEECPELSKEEIDFVKEDLDRKK